ncbi:MAG: GDSL-type esterase/lipase family protein [Bacteroidales bacterium]|nr:GDSL-type esterase/lipase family protein [Bacteroidales bacterium]
MTFAFLTPEDFEKYISSWQLLPENPIKKEQQRKSLLLAELKKKDSAIAAINAQYSLDPKIFNQQNLSTVPLEPFFYDTSDGKNPLINFYQDLLRLQQNPILMRILHYGDSQIENDRITSSFRSLMQEAFGGNGHGVLPLFQSDYKGYFDIKISSNWSVMSMRSNMRRGNYGLCNSYLYPPAINAIITQKNVDMGTVAISRISAGKGLFLEALLHEDVWVEKDFRVTAQKGTTTQNLTQSVKSENSFGLQHIVWKLPDSITAINTSMSFLKNRNIYALSINGKTGIVVDNLAIRGSLGDIFLKNNRRFLMDNYALMNVRLVVYEFGINALPQDGRPATEKDFEFYEKMLQQELGYLRITAPDVPVIVIGISDRSYKNGLSWRTNPSVYYVREIQRKVALENGCVFWDLFNAMGGENSMQEWASVKLGGKDFVHFTDKGAELVGKMLYKALIDDYRKFVIKQKQKEISAL